MTSRFDPTRAVVFDLSRGQLRDDEGTARLNLPFHLISRLIEHAGAEAARDFALSLGAELGRRIKDRMGADVDAAGLEAWAEHLGGQVALVGLGNLQLERWGKAMVFRVTDAPEASADLLPLVLEGALQRGTGRQLTVVAFPVVDSIALLVVSQATAEKARGLMAAGEGLGQVVETLHRGVA